jgi:RNA polymerase sigma factor (sigma-70 family)
MQETFISVLRNLRTLREPAALYGWVRRIAVREAIRVARSGREDPIDPATLVGFSSVAPIDMATVIDVRTTLAGLAPEQRAILVLRDVDGLSEAEAAQILGVAPGTVKSRLHRARSAFVRRWEP